jgi:hypothetical protein
MYMKTPRDVKGKFLAAKKLLEEAQKCPAPAKPFLIGAAAGAAILGLAKIAFDKITD